MALYSTVFCYPKILKKDSHNPQGLRLRFGLFRFRSSLTNGITIVFFSSSYIRYFSSEGVHPDKSGLLCLRKAEFPSFGNRRIKACLAAPRRYRRLHRPSSACFSKASAVCIIETTFGYTLIFRKRKIGR